MSESYGAVTLDKLNTRIQTLIAKKPTRLRLSRINKLMQLRDTLIAKSAAKKGAALAAASIPGVAGGLASSGIRGMDVVEHEFGPQVIRDHNVDGAMQGLRQSSVAPPGSGRLVPINFVVAGATNPMHELLTPAAAVPGIGANQAWVTQSINWAVLRIVGLTTQTLAAIGGSFGLMQDFRIGGSPNLFLVEDWVLMDDYDTDKEQFTGLRAYPILIAPNTALLTAACSAPTGAGLNAVGVYAMVSVVCEVLRDDAFGPGLPGAYAR
jgi:hypothetical protein